MHYLEQMHSLVPNNNNNNNRKQTRIANIAIKTKRVVEKVNTRKLRGKGRSETA